jgi:hypothetical protein
MSHKKKTAVKIRELGDNILWSRQESNLDLEFRKLLFYPLNYGTNTLYFIKGNKSKGK